MAWNEVQFAITPHFFTEGLQAKTMSWAVNVHNFELLMIAENVEVNKYHQDLP